MLEELRQLHAELIRLKKDISKENNSRIAKIGLKKRAEDLATMWFTTLSPSLAQHPIVNSEVIERYSGSFASLLKLVRSNNLRTSYLEVLGSILRKCRDELIVPIQTEPKLAKEVSLLEKMLEGLPSTEEDAYLKEAIACARSGFLRAAAVLGWCAAVDRIHRSIEKLGFDKFNSTSKQMAAATSGRFKRFNSPAAVASMGELREVYDSNILWVLEGMQLIDGNQHTRLRSCFELRCQSGHPGDAPVTEYNLLSFFSDVNQIVLRNPIFEV
jgi:hypothetical protein